MIAIILIILLISFQAYEIMIFMHVLFSWIYPVNKPKFVLVVAQLVEPYISVFRKVIPPVFGLDFSPIIAFLVISLASKGLLTLFII